MLSLKLLSLKSLSLKSLALRLLWRNWRSGEVKILASALLLAVAVVSAIGVFTDRLERSLVKESSSFLGADLIVRSANPIPSDFLTLAEQHGVRQARVYLFSSMIFAGEDMHLASVKAVTGGYPLVGRLEISQVPFAVKPKDIVVPGTIPEPGEAWVDSRLLPLLNVELGDQVSVGEKDLTVTRVIIREPDRGDGFSLFGARLLMNATDLPATEVVRPGSRVTYQWLLAGDEPLLKSFMAKIKPKLNNHQRIVDLESAQKGLAKTLSTGRQFLLLAGVIGVLLAGIAIAIAAQRFAARHIDQVALMKSLGASAWRIRQLYFVQLLVLAVIASALGLLAGELIQQLVANALSALLSIELGPASAGAYAMGVMTGLVCLLFFAMPPLWHLPTVPPLKILRREMEVQSLHAWVQGGLGVGALVVLIWVFSGDLKITASMIIGFGVILGAVGLGALGLLKGGRQLGMRAGHIWRLALASLQRRRGQSVMQILVFATALMLLMALTTIRTNLIDDWKVQLPESAPNHFLVNIAPHQVESVGQLFSDQGLQTSGLYPMVRGRVVSINGEVPDQTVRRRAEVLRREANFSWTEDLRQDNKLIAGQWWDQWQAPAGTAGLSEAVWGVSVESEIAEKLGLSLGDRVGFSVGGLEMEAVVASFRQLNWDSMQPNFYFLFSPGALDQYAPMYLSSVYLPPEQKLLINDLLRRFPTIVVIEMDKVIEQIRKIVDQVSGGVELVLWLVLCGGFLVLLAAVNASMDSRMQEAGLLRALGSRRQLVMGSLWLEFSMLGLFAGLLAVLGAEILLLSLQYWVMDIPLQPHYSLWLLGPLGGALLIGLLGVFSCRKVVTVAPGVVLRELD